VHLTSSCWSHRFSLLCPSPKGACSQNARALEVSYEPHVGLMQLKQHTTPCASVNSLFTGEFVGRTLLSEPALEMPLLRRFTANAVYFFSSVRLLFYFSQIAGIGARCISGFCSRLDTLT
jgi:hypothetical protein